MDSKKHQDEIKEGWFVWMESKLYKVTKIHNNFYVDLLLPDGTATSSQLNKCSKGSWKDKINWKMKRTIYKI